MYTVTHTKRVTQQNSQDCIARRQHHTILVTYIILHTYIISYTSLSSAWLNLHEEKEGGSHPTIIIIILVLHYISLFLTIYPHPGSQTGGC